MKRFTTTRKAIGFQAMVCTQQGQPTGYKLSIPYSSPHKIALGSLEFEVRVSGQGRHYAYAQGPIPESWFIDLNAAPVIEEVAA